MAIKVERRDGHDEKRIVTAMVVDRSVLAKIASRWEKGMFNSPWSNLVGQWCVDFFNRYDKPPGKSIEGIFNTWAGENKQPEVIRLVEKFLSGISGEYKSIRGDINADYIVDSAAAYFNRVKLAKLSEGLQALLDNGDVDKAKKLADTYAHVELGAGSGVDVFDDDMAFEDAFSENAESIIQYPGALGNFFGDALSRDALIAFQGPEKSGKTQWEIDVAWNAMKQNRKVAFFEVGDMSQNQIMRRFIARAAGRPMKPGVVRFPKFLEQDGGVANCDFTEREFKFALSMDAAREARKKIVSRRVGDQSLFRLSVHPNSSISVLGVQSVLQSWERAGWSPDVCVIDYADILAPINGTVDTRDQINSTWKHLRALSQSFHMLVVTATQSNAGSYDSEVQSKKNFSEDKRKYAHVNGMVGINQTVQEKENQIYRLNWLVLREGEFVESKCVYTASCLAISNPAVLSTF